MNPKFINSLTLALLISGIGALIIMYSDIQVLKSQVQQILHEQEYYHGAPIK